MIFPAAARFLRGAQMLRLAFQPARNSGAATVPRRESRHRTRRAYDTLMFHVTLVALPFVSLIAYLDIRVGKAVLSDIPEGYEPEEYEYQCHPVTRFLQRYLYKSEKRYYEKMMAVEDYHERKRQRSVLEHRVRKLMSATQDYQGWYWVPAFESDLEAGRDWERFHREKNYYPDVLANINDSRK